MKFNIFKNLSIANKLIILFLLLGIGSTVLVGVYSYFSAKHSLTERTFDQLTSIRVAKKKRIEGFFADRFRDIDLFSKTSEVSGMLDNLDNSTRTKNGRSGSLYGEYASFLKSYVISYGYYDKFIVLNSKGKMLYTPTTTADSMNKFSIDSVKYKSISVLWKEVSGSPKAIFRDFALDDFNENSPAYYMATPVFSSFGKIRGMIALQISFDAINSIMLESSSDNGLGESGESYLVGNDYLMRSTSRFRPNSIMVQPVKTVASMNALTGQKELRQFRITGM